MCVDGANFLNEQQTNNTIISIIPPCMCVYCSAHMGHTYRNILSVAFELISFNSPEINQ